MATESDPRPWEALEEIARAGDASRLEQFVASLPPMEAVRAITRLNVEDQARVLAMLPAKRAADLLEETPEVEAREMLEHLSPEDAAAILAEMPSDEQADLLTGLSDADAESILDEMPESEAAEARSLVRFKPDEAGGLMVTAHLAFHENSSVARVLDDLRTNAERYAGYDVQYVYVTSSFNDLVGVLPLRDLLLTRPDRQISDLMIRAPLAVDSHATLDELNDVFGRHGFLGVPVIDRGGRLIGVVRRADVEQALAERAGRSFLKTQGIIGGDELRTMPTMVRTWRRFYWLSANILLNILAASVIAFYEETLAQVIALAVFLPIISDMSGNAGIQASAVSMRELELGLIRPRELLRVWTKEISLGLINGIALGVLLGTVAFIWKGNAWLGAVVGAAMMLNTIVAVTVGGTIPLILKMLKKDPALASGPILTTVTDMCGFFFALSFATLLLSKLT